jgi:hypothetical protein
MPNHYSALHWAFKSKNFSEASSSSATAAGISEGNAAASALAAGVSEGNAAASESAAGVSAANALASETNAASSEAAAGVSAANALASEEAAASSAGAAAGSATEAGEKATAASGSATAAAASEENAKASEDAAATYAEIAGTAASGTKDRGTVVNALTSQGTGYGIDSIGINDGGTGYHEGDALIMGSDVSLVDAVFVVNSVDSETGAVTDISISKSGVWPSMNLGNISISGGHGTGFDPSFDIAETPYTTLDDILYPTQNDTAYVLQDELHSNSMYMWKYADYNGDGISNWVPIAPFIQKLATANTAGLVRPDGTSIAVDISGTISVVPTARADTVLDADYAADEDFTVPDYIVGRNHLTIWLGGALCAPGTSATDGFYQEVGTSGETSATIKIFEDLPVGATITAVVAA